MAKIRFVRSVMTATVGQVQPGDVHDVTQDDADRYVRNEWAEHVKAPAPKKRAAR